MKTVPTKLKADWLQADGVLRVVKALGHDAVKFVGGAVRDTLAERPVADIDAATIHKPEVTMALLQDAGIKVIPTGLQHGTITAIASDLPIEITTLRVDVKTDGRHAEVAFTDDWLEDAKRRDFTINSLYCSPSGELYDPFGGVDDLAASKVRFIGSAEERIKEDALRIMRFFRFSARYGKGELDPSALKACENLRSMLDALSAERVRDELMKMAAWPDFITPISAMAHCGILQQLYGLSFNRQNIEDLCQNEVTLQILADPLIRFYELSSSVLNANEVSKKYRLSNSQRNKLKLFEQAKRQHATLDLTSLYELLYKFGAWTIEQIAIVHAHSNFDAIIEECQAWKQPVFPVKGKDIIALGIEAGPNVGRRMKELERAWVASGFKLSKEELLSI